jgi:uncharacterized Tic20 family protein
MKTQDERIMAALSHVMILLPMAGVIVPIVIWATQRETSEFVAFQALQALIYQLVLIGLWFVGIGCYMISIFGTLGTGIVLSEIAPELGAPGMLGFFLPFVIFGSVFLIGFLYIAYGTFGAVQVFRGRDFHYVLIGRWVERYTSRQTPEA